MLPFLTPATGDRRLHLHAADLVHPEHRVLGAVDQDARQHGVRSAAGDAQQVVHVVLARVWNDALVEALVFFFDPRQQRREIVRIVESDAQHRAGPMCVAAPHVARRFLEHEHAVGTVLMRRDRGGKRRVAGTDDNDVILFHCSFFLRRSSRPDA